MVRLRLVLFLASLLVAPSLLLAFTTVENSTSIGFYRDYQQQGHVPLYHSWSLHGYYTRETEATFNIYLNNDFSAKNWGVYLTQAMIETPLIPSGSLEPRRYSRLKLGRQIFTEGFDFSLLDGAQSPIYWSPHGGVMPIAGVLRSPDVDQAADVSSPLLGLVFWQQLESLKLRVGATARDEDLKERNIFSSLLVPIASWSWSPQVFYKEERASDTFGLRQMMSELQLAPTRDISMRISYSELHPRPIRKRDLTSFLYRLFSISPTRSTAIDLSWDQSSERRFNFGTTMLAYDSKFRAETASRQEIGTDLEVAPGRWASFVLTRLEAYGGNVFDGGTHFTYKISDASEVDLQYDVAYLDKINGIRSWAHHLRSGYKRELSQSMTAIFGIEGERNQYYEFDLRTMLYVANIY